VVIPHFKILNGFRKTLTNVPPLVNSATKVTKLSHFLRFTDFLYFVVGSALFRIIYFFINTRVLFNRSDISPCGSDWHHDIFSTYRL